MRQESDKEEFQKNVCDRKAKRRKRVRHQKNVCDRKATRRDFKKTCATGKRQARKEGFHATPCDKRRENSVKMRDSDEDHQQTNITNKTDSNTISDQPLLTNIFESVGIIHCSQRRSVDKLLLTCPQTKTSPMKSTKASVHSNRSEVTSMLNTTAA